MGFIGFDPPWPYLNTLLVIHTVLLKEWFLINIPSINSVDKRGVYVDTDVCKCYHKCLDLHVKCISLPIGELILIVKRHVQHITLFNPIIY